MKRSDREGRWAEIPSPRARFALEAAFLIVVAAGAALARLSPLGIIGLMLVAWLLVALIERASSREQAKAFAGPPEEAPLTEEPEVAVGRGWLFGRRRRETPEALPSPEAALEERPSRAHVTRLEPEAPGRGDRRRGDRGDRREATRSGGDEAGRWSSRVWKSQRRSLSRRRSRLSASADQGRVRGNREVPPRRTRSG